MKRVLFVDDEVQILHSLVRAFLDTDYEVRYATSGEAALCMMEEEVPDIVISDMRMPLMDGYQLLSIVKERWPETMRVILSGYADESVVFNALQKNVAKIYVFKPWNNDALIQLVAQLFETEDLLKESNLMLLINNLEDLPTIQSSYRRIVSLIEQDRDLTEITAEMERDQSISTKTLQIANSAFYGVKSGSVRQAASFLGLQNIRSLILSTSIIDSLKAPPTSAHQMETIWRHASLTNKFTALLHEKIMRKRIPDAFSAAGLLHNVGNVLLLHAHTKVYLSMLLAARASNSDLMEMERARFRTTHQEMGGYLLKWWELPYPIVETALYHHRPFDKRIVNRELVSLVHLSQKYAWDALGEKDLYPFYPEAYMILGVSQSAADGWIASSDLAKGAGV